MQLGLKGGVGLEERVEIGGVLIGEMGVLGLALSAVLPPALLHIRVEDVFVDQIFADRNIIVSVEQRVVGILEKGALVVILLHEVVLDFGLVLLVDGIGAQLDVLFESLQVRQLPSAQNLLLFPL